MKYKIMLMILGGIFTSQIIYSQAPSDSINILKEQKRIAEITARIDKNKLKLAQLEKEFSEKTNNEEKALQQAKESVEDNRMAADKLSDDPTNKRKARKAERQSDDAKRDTKKARRASKKLNGLQKEIKVLKRQIVNDEKKISK